MDLGDPRDADFHLCKILSAEEHVPSTVRGMINFEKSKYLYNLVSQVPPPPRSPRPSQGSRLRVWTNVTCWLVDYHRHHHHRHHQLMQHQEHPYNLQPVSKIDLLSATVYQISPE
jgi:hypothetical protein